MDACVCVETTRARVREKLLPQAVALTLALLRCGARTFTLFYSSCALFVSIFSAHKHALSAQQWALRSRVQKHTLFSWFSLCVTNTSFRFLGGGGRSLSKRSASQAAVLVATGGVVAYSIEPGGGTGGGDLLGALLALTGSLGHSAMFVVAERTIEATNITPFALSCVSHHSLTTPRTVLR